MPDRPASEPGSAPSAVANRVLSARPRVMIRAVALWPGPMPVAMPTASAITFFRAPPISQPITSVEV